MNADQRLLFRLEMEAEMISITTNFIIFSRHLQVAAVAAEAVLAA